MSLENSNFFVIRNISEICTCRRKNRICKWTDSYERILLILDLKKKTSMLYRLHNLSLFSFFVLTTLCPFLSTFLTLSSSSCSLFLCFSFFLSLSFWLLLYSLALFSLAPKTSPRIFKSIYKFSLKTYVWMNKWVTFCEDRRHLRILSKHKALLADWALFWRRSRSAKGYCLCFVSTFLCFIQFIILFIHSINLSLIHSINLSLIFGYFC